MASPNEVSDALLCARLVEMYRRLVDPQAQLAEAEVRRKLELALNEATIRFRSASGQPGEVCSGRPRQDPESRSGMADAELLEKLFGLYDQGFGIAASAAAPVAMQNKFKREVTEGGIRFDFANSEVRDTVVGLTETARGAIEAEQTSSTSPRRSDSPSATADTRASLLAGDPAALEKGLIELSERLPDADAAIARAAVERLAVLGGQVARETAASKKDLLKTAQLTDRAIHRLVKAGDHEEVRRRFVAARATVCLEELEPALHAYHRAIEMGLRAARPSEQSGWSMVEKRELRTLLNAAADSLSAHFQVAGHCGKIEVYGGSKGNFRLRSYEAGKDPWFPLGRELPALGLRQAVG